jgi:PilZ domain
MGNEAPEGVERRFGKRVKLPLTVRVRVEDGPELTAKVRDVNARGMGLDFVVGGEPGRRLTIDFDGYPGVCEAFSLVGRVVNVFNPVTSGVGVEVDRKATPPEGVQSYRTLVLHYLHNRPLLDGVAKGYFEGRCTNCGWVGRVGAKAPRCPRCAAKVESARNETGPAGG